MQQIDFEIDFGLGFQPVIPPRNWKEMKVQVIFTGAILQAQLQTINFEWVNQTAEDILSYINAGKSGGTGIYEGAGLRVYVGVNHLLIFDGCLDTANQGLEIQNGILKCPIKESGKIDWFNDVAASIDFQYLSSLPIGSPGSISRSDYKNIPYVISTIPNYTQASLLSISLFVMVKEAVDVIFQIEAIVAHIISDSLTWIKLIAEIIVLIIYMVYLAAIITSCVTLTQDLCDNIYQNKKIKLGMREQDLWKKGCDYFGLKFQSTIYGVNVNAGYDGKYINATWIPKKIVTPIGNPISEIFKRPADESTNPNAFGYYEGTFKSFISTMCLLYNAKIIINNGTLYFEELHHWNISNPFKLPNQGEIGYTYNYPQPYSTNASELQANYVIAFQKDDQEINTYNDYSGTYCVAQSIPKKTKNIRNNLLTGGQRIEFPCALARRKLGYTKTEKELKNVLDALVKFLANVTQASDHINNQFIKEFKKAGSDKLHLSDSTIKFAAFAIQGTIPVIGNTALMFGALAGRILPPITKFDMSDQRIGWMLLSNDFIGVPKRFIGTQAGSDWLIDQDNQDNVVVVGAPQITGTFFGTVFFGGFTVVISGPVVNGVLGVAVETMAPGFQTGTATGSITGQKGVFTILLSGTGTGAFTFCLATGYVSTASSTSPSVVNFGKGGASSLMIDFHRLNLPIANANGLPTVQNNQWLIFKNKKFKLSESDFVQINNNNVFTTADNKLGKFDKLIWDIHNDEAIDVDYRVQEDYTSNLTLTISDDGG